MAQSTDQVRREIEQTRAEMGGTIDAIADRTSPRRVVVRSRRRVVARMRGARDAVMGTAEQTAHEAQARGGHMADEAKQVPERVARQTKGNPLAAGLVAFGGGLIAATLIPPSRQEQQMASRLREEAQPAVDQMREAGKHVAEEVKASAQESAQQVRESAGESAQHVTEEAKRTAREQRGSEPGF